MMVFPDHLKSAKVVTLFKKGDQHILDNYRYISLPPVVFKASKVVFNELHQYVTDNNLIFTSHSMALENYIPQNMHH